MSFKKLYIIFCCVFSQCMVNANSIFTSDTCEIFEIQMFKNLTSRNTVWSELENFYCEVSYVSLKIDPKGRVQLKPSSIISQNMSEVLTNLINNMNKVVPQDYCSMQEYDFILALRLQPYHQSDKHKYDALVDEMVDNFIKLNRLRNDVQLYKTLVFPTIR